MKRWGMVGRELCASGIAEGCNPDREKEPGLVGGKYVFKGPLRSCV